MPVRARPENRMKIAREMVPSIFNARELVRSASDPARSKQQPLASL